MQAEPRGSTTREGFAVLLVAIKREPVIFTLSTIGSLLFGALTVADAWVLGWATDNVVLPAFREGEVDSQPALGDPRAVPRRRDPARGRHRRAPARRGHHAVPHAGPLPPRRHPPVPLAPDGVAPAPPHRAAALQRQLRRRGRLGPDRAAADGGRHRRHDGDRGRPDARRRPGAGPRRHAGLPGRDRRQPLLPAAGLAADDPRPAAPRRAQRGRARVLRRRDGRQDPRPRDRGDRPVRGQGPRAARRQHPRRPDPRGVRPDARCPAEPRRPGRARGRRRRACSTAPPIAGRRGDRRLPAHDRVLPDPLDRLAAGRVPAQRGRLPPGQRGARRHRRDAVRRPRGSPARRDDAAPGWSWPAWPTPTTRTSPCSTTSRSPSSPAGPSRWSAPPPRARARSRP